MIRVLQVDGDGGFRQEVREYCSRLKDFQYVAELENGAGILGTIEATKPDIVLLSLDLKPQGGVAVLEEIRTHFSSAQVAVILFATSEQHESVLQQAAAFGADYYILRPVDLVVLESRIRQLTNGKPYFTWGNITFRQVQEVCTRYFELMGVPPHFKGYRYLMEGIWLGALHPTWLSSVTQNLYPAIGQRFATNGAQVERAMRYALDVTWEKGNVEELYRIFPYEIRENKGKPTNSAFIAKMVDLVGLEIGRCG